MAPKGDAPLWRLVDVRWLFPSEAAAQAYLDASWDALSERQPEVPAKVDPVVPGARVFGGTHKDPILDLESTQFFVVFRQGRTVVKLFAAEGPEAKAHLTLAAVNALAKKVVTRVGALPKP
ncbi:MAG: hypothetical protein U1F43_01115 [Myxococcota bacterium]